MAQIATLVRDACHAPGANAHAPVFQLLTTGDAQKVVIHDDLLGLDSAAVRVGAAYGIASITALPKASLEIKESHRR